jgi:L,D-transpeptidase catalytic domain
MLRCMLLIFTCLVQTAFAANNPSTSVTIDKKQILKNAPKINPKALNYALKGYKWALKKEQVKNPNILTLIDFTKPSNEKRLWVINLATNKVLMKTYTTHGKNSGLRYAKSFSNTRKTKKTSLGVYKTMNSYKGKHGVSLRIKGLEKGINDNAGKRAIVFHPAFYATEHFVKKYHRAGRSWGCFALSPKLSKRFVNAAKDGSIVIAYGDAVKNDPILTQV